MSQWLRLSLVFPAHLETVITEALTADARMPGFTLLRAEGHTSDFGRASVIEKVRGRVDRRVLWMLMPAENKEAVIELLSQHCDSRDVRWWTEAVLESGRLG